MRYDFKGFWDCESHCDLEIKRLPGRVVVIATEVADNEGTSITNMAEHLATRVCQDFNIDPMSLVWIEHYHADSYRYLSERDRAYNARPEEYSVVTFDWNGRSFTRPQWKYLSKADLIALIGEEV